MILTFTAATTVLHWERGERRERVGSVRACGPAGKFGRNREIETKRKETEIHRVRADNKNPEQTAM